jgi:hypothetical protein
MEIVEKSAESKETAEAKESVIFTDLRRGRPITRAKPYAYRLDREAEMERIVGGS